MKPKNRVRKRIVWFLAGFALLLPTFFGISNARVLNFAKSRTYADLNSIPHHRVAIILGTSAYFAGKKNLFFEGRMDAAARLYNAGKVERVLVSGDNSRADYDEPTAMEDALIKRGVLAAHITKDYAGFRTLDTMVRARQIFGLDDATVVTDDFHMARSLYHAQGAGISADGYLSESLPDSYTESVRFREVLARGLAVLDVDVMHKKPKFLGKPEPIH